MNSEPHPSPEPESEPLNPEQANNPENAPESPFQQLGWLHIPLGAIALVCVKPCGVELILSSGLSICIHNYSFNKLGYSDSRSFALALEMGESFPVLNFSLKPTKDFLPRWASEPDDPKPSKPAITDEDNRGGNIPVPPPTPPQVTRITAPLSEPDSAMLSPSAGGTKCIGGK